MKTANSIITHIASLPQFKPLKKEECYRKYISFLSPKWQQGIAFVYIKNDILFIAVKHPAYKQELNSNINTLMNILINLNRYIQPCQEIKASEIRVFHSKYYPIETEKKPSLTRPYYKEQAHGAFRMPKNNEPLKEIFEKIQNDIQCNR